MRTMRTRTWHCLRAGHHVMTAWIGDAQLTFSASRTASGWELTRSVAGAGVTVIAGNLATLSAARAIAEEELDAGLL